ncbi:hypothetical protein CMV_000344 [Castanea mollissima]|uniref:Large ribosomal subunit protein bL34m n=1 Tax=Castanea mollissima TaxID=60419 RepID=A0A8J4S1I0_9ROSI|nr:hypothetical protein CMV_000344 [Castanea mollissima]
MKITGKPQLPATFEASFSLNPSPNSDLQLHKPSTRPCRSIPHRATQTRSSQTTPPPHHRARPTQRIGLWFGVWLGGAGYVENLYMQGDVSSSNEQMILFPKRTFQPSTIQRKRNHGFFDHKATKGGRNVIARRIAKGRFRITA